MYAQGGRLLAEPLLWALTDQIDGTSLSCLRHSSASLSSACLCLHQRRRNSIREQCMHQTEAFLCRESLAYSSYHGMCGTQYLLVHCEREKSAEDLCSSACVFVQALQGPDYFAAFVCSGDTARLFSALGLPACPAHCHPPASQGTCHRSAAYAGH